MVRPVARIANGFLAAALGTLGMTAVASAAPAAENYVALGDSYSAGVGAGNYGDSGACKRSANAYPELWAADHDVADFSFVACLGARTADVLNSQVDALSAETTLVTISIGGNDAGFTDVITTCTLGSDETCTDRVEEAEQFVQDTLPDRLEEVYVEIESRAPNAEVVVLGYPRLYKLDGSCNIGLSETKRAAINSGSDALAQAIADEVDEAGFTFVDMREPFSGHEICSSDWWLHSLTWPVDESYHPNQEGQALGYLPELEAVTG